MLVLSAGDVFDIAGSADEPTILGDGEDRLDAAESRDWSYVDSGNGFDSFTATDGAPPMTLYVARDLQSDLDRLATV